VAPVCMTASVSAASAPMPACRPIARRASAPRRRQKHATCSEVQFVHGYESP